MSPEQLIPGLDVHMRSDVYALGVPAVRAAGRRAAVRGHDLSSDRPRRRAGGGCCKPKPTRPSARLATHGSGDGGDGAAARRMEVRALRQPAARRSRLGPLLKALEKDRTRRYPFVSELIADHLERHLRTSRCWRDGGVGVSRRGSSCGGTRWAWGRRGVTRDAPRGGLARDDRGGAGAGAAPERDGEGRRPSREAGLGVLVGLFEVADPTDASRGHDHGARDSGQGRGANRARAGGAAAGRGAAARDDGSGLSQSRLVQERPGAQRPGTHPPAASVRPEQPGGRRRPGLARRDHVAAGRAQGGRAARPRGRRAVARNFWRRRRPRSRPPGARVGGLPSREHRRRRIRGAGGLRALHPSSQSPGEGTGRLPRSARRHSVRQSGPRGRRASL